MKKYILNLLLFLFFNTLLYSADHYWICNSIDNSFSNPSNWSTSTNPATDSGNSTVFIDTRNSEKIPTHTIADGNSIINGVINISRGAPTGKNGCLNMLGGTLSSTQFYVGITNIPGTLNMYGGTIHILPISPSTTLQYSYFHLMGNETRVNFHGGTIVSDTSIRWQNNCHWYFFNAGAYEPANGAYKAPIYAKNQDNLTRSIITSYPAVGN